MSEMSEEDKRTIQKLEDVIINLENMTRKMEAITTAIMDGCNSNNPEMLQKILEENGILDEQNKG